MKKLLIVLLAIGAVHAYAEEDQTFDFQDSGLTHVPSTSSYSYDEARNGCYRPSSTTGLSAGRPVGRVIYGDGPYIVVCERNDERGKLTYVPSSSTYSYNEARNGCYRSSSTTGLSAGRPVGRGIYGNGPYIVVCERPNQ